MRAPSAFENLYHGICNLLDEFHLRRHGLQRPPEELLDSPEHDQIEFVTLSPNSDAPDQLRSFAQISEGWVRRHSESFVFDLATLLVRDYRVLLRMQQKHRIEATIEDSTSYPVEILLTPDGLSAHCACGRSQQNPSPTMRHADWLRCEHIVAVLLYALSERTRENAVDAEAPPLCPITRQRLTVDRRVYQCTKCQVCYSQEGWEFLRTEDHGRCCHCHSRKTIRLLRPGG